MADKSLNALILFEKSIFKDTAFYKNVESYIFDQNNFGFGSNIIDGVIDKYFGSKDEAVYNFHRFDPEIEYMYYDLEKGNIRTLIISFYNLADDLRYALVAYNPYIQIYEVIFMTWDIKKIDTRENDRRLIDKNINNWIVKYALDKKLSDLSSLTSDVYFSLTEALYRVDERKCSDELRELLLFVLAKSINIDNPNDIKLNLLTVDVEQLENPILLSAEFGYQDKKYLCYLETQEIEEIDSFDYGDIIDTYRDVFLELASKKFISENRYLFKEKALEKKRKNALDFFSSLYKRFTLIEFEADTYGFDELGEPYLLLLGEDGVSLRTTRNIDSDEFMHFDYDSLTDNKNQIKRIIDKYLLSKTKEYEELVQDINQYVSGSFDLETIKSKGEELLDRASSIPVYDKNTATFAALINKVKEKYDKANNLNKGKISRALNLINKIKDVSTYNEYSDELFDAIEELDEGELAAIKNEYEMFIDAFGDIPQYISDQTIYRRVFIRKSTLDELKRINLEQRDLKVLSVVDEIVDQLKSLPGNQLGKYLLNKGLNFPINNDHSIKKIRIMRNAKYRLLFVYGSDLDADDRLNNLDSIYIFGVTEHKKDKAELYRVAESKPTKYEINDFIIYPKNKIVKIPECTSEQYKIATAYEEQPVITFGCAGSGKTTVSIEQYVNIVYSKYNCVSPKTDELVYITFHKGLSDKVKKDLAEFKIDGNCYKLDEYYAYVIGEKYDQSKAINELKFIEWFDRSYSDTEIKKNKGKKKNKISPLLDKPDIARLLYTYYRGVFKGSKELLNTQDNYLSFDLFMSEMSGETYLSDEEKGAIYQICTEFDEYASSEGLLGDNDYAIKVIRQSSYKIKRTKCIIIDEVQDLTEIEIIATIMTLNEDSTRIYFYGDPHQSINPNVFDSSTINKVYTALGKTTSSESAPLTITYRTNRHLISYLNELLKYRDKWIGLTKGGLSEIIEPPKTDEDTSWAGYVINKSLYKRIFESNPNSMIITPSESVKKRLLEKYPDIVAARVITIYEAKGMEWDTIIMYNMFTDYESYFLDMISENGKAKKSTIHRMTFNKYYVGCTRSTKSFVIIEENEKIFDENHPIFKTLLSSFAPISKAEQIDTYILEDNTFDAWYKEALQNLDNDNPATFEHALMHARRLAKTAEDIRLINELIEGNPETLERYGFSYLEKGEYDLARSAFVKCNKATKKHGPYILLASIMGGRLVSDDHLREFLKHKEVIDKYPEVLPKLMKQPAFRARLRKLKNRLFDEEDK